MSDRIVMDLIDFSDSVLLQVREPEGHGGMSKFDCTGQEKAFEELRKGSPTSDVVAEAGRVLYNALTVVQPVRVVMESALQIQEPDRRTVYFDLTEANNSQTLPWEAIQGDQGFLALSSCWPVARMLGGSKRAVTTRTFTPPLRIAAVLSCIGVEAELEWNALRRAVENSNAPVRVLLFVSEIDLHDELAYEKPQWLSDLQMVPAGYADLQMAITDFKPHVLHFFCHGSSIGGAHLEIADAADVLAGATTSRHRLESRSIRQLVQPPNDPPWAIVLNACASADNPEPDSELHSLTAGLVSDQGVPAVIGMREPILHTDAARFTEAYYNVFLGALTDIIGSNSAEAKLDWAGYSVNARNLLCQGRDLMFEQAAARYKQWTLPVVVVRRQEFILDLKAQTMQRQREAEGAAAMLAALPVSTPAETRKAFEELLSNDGGHADAAPHPLET